MAFQDPLKSPYFAVALALYNASRRIRLSGSLFAGVLTDIGVALTEQVGAAGQIPQEAFVDHFGRDGDGLVFLGFEIGCPGVEGAGVVGPQRLLPGYREPRLGGVLFDLRAQRQTTTGVDLVHDEL